MNSQIWPRLLVLLSLLIGGLGQTRPAQAQTDPTKLVIWCPATVTLPTPKQNGCTAAFTKIADLWGVLVTKNPAMAGTIWIGKNYKSNDANVMDGNQLWDGLVLTKMAKYALTFKGGWNGKGTGTLSTSQPSTFDGASFHIVNWKGNVTLRNLKVQNATTTYCLFLNNVALCVYTRGNIKLDRVEVSNSHNLGSGAFLDNTTSVSSPPAVVTVTNSQFNKTNDNHGLEVHSKGRVSLINLLAESNGETGTYVDNTAGSGGVLLKGTNTFLGNGNYGLEVQTNGSVSATHLIAYDNISDGVRIRATKAVTITGSGKFKGNTGTGLAIDTSGPIAAKNLTVVSNIDGLKLWTDVPISVAPQAVILSYVNANLNLNRGLEINADGRVTLICSSTFGNITGLYVRGADETGPAAVLKLKGFLSYGTDEDIDATPVIRTDCP